MQDFAVISSPVGKLKLELDNGQLCQIQLECKEPLVEARSPALLAISAQLASYFQTAESKFELKFRVKGTDFQHRVWGALRNIPVGTVKTYGELAKELKSSARAVGNACRRNPTPIVVPCHRVVSAAGLGGFAGKTEGSLTVIKAELLKHEGVMI